ncbi:hypothetical protein BX666DRAFT_2026612 [Dichotomocladium elegans]|nr:hypothetical protein BX666DRAFT_2026612 [Dichotomocladium elegans]
MFLLRGLYKGFSWVTVVSFNGRSEVNYKERLSFDDGYEKCDVYIKQALDPAYGCYVWPSALVMADYVWHARCQFKGRTVLEITNPPKLVLTDTSDILATIRECLELNGIHQGAAAMVCELRWGDLDSITHMLGKMSVTWPLARLDYILGSDTFYDPKDFESLFMTVAYIFRTHNPNCKFITAYQERSAKRSIQYLLEKWGLACRTISREDFEFDDTRYLDANNRMSEIKVNSGILSSVFLLEITLIAK